MADSNRPRIKAENEVWDVPALDWVAMLQPVIDGGTITAVIGGTLATREVSSTVSTRTQVADNSADVLLLASNANRLGATIFNDSSALVYVGYGTTAVTSSNYSAKLFPNGYLEVPFGFTGQIRGIWATDPGDGSARISELT